MSESLPLQTPQQRRKNIRRYIQLIQEMKQNDQTRRVIEDAKAALRRVERANNYALASTQN